MFWGVIMESRKKKELRGWIITVEDGNNFYYIGTSGRVMPKVPESKNYLFSRKYNASRYIKSRLTGKRYDVIPIYDSREEPQITIIRKI